MLLRALYVPVNFPAGPSPAGPQALETPLHPVGPKPPVTIVPSFFSLMCSQCSLFFTLAVVRRSGSEQALVFPEGSGGLEIRGLRPPFATTWTQRISAGQRVLIARR
jgi:hypothetical protein